MTISFETNTPAAALEVRNARYAQQARPETVKPGPRPDGQENATPSKTGDTVRISEEAKTKARDSGAQNLKADLPEPEQASSSNILQKRIDRLKQEIREIKQSDLPMKQKQKLLQEKESELAQLVQQQEQGRTARQIKDSFDFSSMGTSAEGFAKSLS
jgi:hypothetical protein